MASDRCPAIPRGQSEVLWQKGEPPHPRSWLPIYAVCLLGFGFFCLYITTLTHAYTFDTVSYALGLRQFLATGDAKFLFHPHHLAFGPASWAMYQFVNWIAPGVSPIVGLQVFTCLMAAIGVAALVAWLYESTDSLWVAVMGGLCLGGSYGWWFCATDGRANVASAAMLICVIYALGRMLRHSSKAWAGVAGILLALTCLLHESHGLFVLPALLAAWLTDGSRAQRLMRVKALLAGLIAFLVIPYALVMLTAFHFHSPADAVRWLFSYWDAGLWWDFNVSKNVLRDAQGLHRFFTGQNLTYENWHLDLGGAWGGYSALMWWTLALGAFVGLVRGVWFRAWKWLAPLGLALVLYCGFFTVWTPGYVVFWLTQGFLLIILMAVGWRWGVLTNAFKIALTALPITMIAITFQGAISQKMDPGQNVQFRAANALAKVVKPKSVVIASGMGRFAEMEVYAPYFARTPVIALHTVWRRNKGDTAKSIAYVQHEIRWNLNNETPVYLFGDILHDAEAQTEMKRRYGITQHDAREMLTGFKRTRVGSFRGIPIDRLTNAPKPRPKVKPAPKPVVKPNVVVRPKPVIKPKPGSTAKSVVKPIPGAAVKPVVKKKPISKPVPKPKPGTKPNAARSFVTP